MFNKNKEQKNNPFEDENFNKNTEAENNNTKESAEETTAEENQEEEMTEEPQENTEEGEDTAKLKEELEALNNKYIRLAADFDNFRKRQMTEKENLLKYGAEDTLKKIITALDTFERARKSVVSLSECEKIKESYEVGIKQLYDTLDKIGLKKIEAKGEEFDPNLHEAVMRTPTNDYPVHTVIDELQTGYKLHDKVLRPTFVNVADEAEEKRTEE